MAVPNFAFLPKQTLKKKKNVYNFGLNSDSEHPLRIATQRSDRLSEPGLFVLVCSRDDVSTRLRPGEGERRCVKLL